MIEYCAYEKSLKCSKKKPMQPPKTNFFLIFWFSSAFSYLKLRKIPPRLSIALSLILHQWPY